MVSDSLQGVLSNEDIEKFGQRYISAAIVVDPIDLSLTGNLVGIEFGVNPKLDIKVLISEVFKFIGGILVDDKRRVASNILLNLGDDSVVISGPFKILNAKIIEIDSINQLCVLAIDLFKITTLEKG